MKVFIPNSQPLSPEELTDLNQLMLIEKVTADGLVSQDEDEMDSIKISSMMEK